VQNNGLSSGSLEEVALIDIGLRDDCRQILLGPLLGGHVLLEDHHLLEAHLLELLRILQNYRRQDVEAKAEVIALYGEVGIE